MTRAPAVLLALLVLTGCGDDALSRRELVAQAEAICAEANAKIDAKPTATTPGEVVTSLKETLEIADEYTGRLERLAARAEDADDVREIFLTPLRGQVEALRKFVPQVEAAAPKGPAAIEALADPQLPEADAEAMRTFGFSSCLKTAQT